MKILVVLLIVLVDFILAALIGAVIGIVMTNRAMKEELQNEGKVGEQK